jgi:hypothetical protein
MSPTRFYAGIAWILLPLTLFSFATAAAQDTQAKYTRKSISYVDAVIHAGEVMLTPEQEAFLLQEIKREIEMSRFDYNPLPPDIMGAFRKQLAERNPMDLDGIAAVMNDVLAPEILRAVDYEKEIRAKGLVDEAARHSFVVEKAKEAGITSAHLETIMNSAYIYIPVISEVKEYDNALTNTINYDLRGGIIWFAVKTGETGSNVQILVKKEAVGKSGAKRSASIGYKGRTLSGPEYAFVTAAEVLARNLRIATQEIPEFQLTNPLTETGHGWVEFGIGKKEGLGVDDKFIISEFYEQPDGSLTQKKLGMVRVARVADNTAGKADSRARTVIGGGYERGMLAQEHPRLPIDLSFRFAVVPIGADKNRNYLNLYFESDASSSLYAGQLWFSYNLARTTKISQFFASIYGEIGGGAISGAKVFGEDAGGGLYWGIGGGLSKKFYVNRLHFGLEALLSFKDYSFTTTVSDVDVEWSASNLGLIFNGNLEVALGYDWNLGAGIGYHAFGPTSDWTYKENDTEYDVSGYSDLPELKFGGLGFQFYLTWSLPSLGYDPLKIARGALDF